MSALLGHLGSSLRGRLVVSYAVVVALTLLVALIALSVLLPGYRARQAEERLAELAGPTLRVVWVMSRNGAGPDEIRAALNEQAMASGLRILVVDRSRRVLADTAETGSLEGQQIDLPELTRPPAPPVSRGPNMMARTVPVVRGRYTTPDGAPYRFAAVPLDLTPNRGRGDPALLVLAQPEHVGFEVWADLGPRLALASGVALAVAAVIGTLMAQSVYRPVARLTAASEAMARGHYDQQVPIEGPAELAALARSFNRMAGEVRTSRQTLQEFVANVSHELRTPLTSVRGFVQALRDGTVTDEAGHTRSLEVIDAEVRRLQRLVAGLLDLSRIESGQAGLRREPFDLAEVLRQCAEIVAGHAEEAGVTLTVEIAPEPPLVTGDADRVEQVIMNLLDNALRYTPAGGRITLALARTSEQAIVTVDDTGAGIPAEALPHLFERFYTADPARAGQGTGLGLAIAREIALAHGGDLTASSTLGQGSTFTLKLPLTRPGDMLR